MIGRETLKSFIALGASTVVILLAIAWTREPAQVGPARKPPIQVEQWADLQRVGQRLGAGDHGAVVVEFSDFQCPYCAHEAAILHELKTEGAGFTLIYRHFPLRGIHPYAAASALAADCAGMQGRFESYHDLLFANQRVLGQISWQELASKANVPSLKTFADCVRDSLGTRRLADDEAAARALNLTGTPVVIVNGMMLDGTPTAEEIRAALRRTAQMHM